MKNRE